MNKLKQNTMQIYVLCKELLNAYGDGETELDEMEGVNDVIDEAANFVNAVKPLTTKVASFPSPFRGRNCLSEIQRCPQYPAAYAASTAARLIRSDKVQVLLFRHRGTFAPMSCFTVAGKGFKISRMKYRAPIL